MARIKQNKLNQIKGYSEYKSRRDGEEEEKSSSVASSGSSVTSGSRIKKSKLEGINHYVPASDEDRQKRQLEVVKENEQRRTARLRELKTQIDTYESASKELSNIMLDANGLVENPDRIRELSRQVTELGKTIDDVKKEYKALSDDPDIRNATLKDMTVNALKRGYYNTKLGMESYADMMGDTGNEKQKYTDILAGDDYQYENTEWWHKLIGGAFEQAGQWGGQIDDRAAAFATTAALATAALGQAGPQALAPEEAITVPGAFATGLKAGMAYNAYESEAGHAYNTMRELGVSEDTARAVAIAVGGGIAALEATQLDEVVKGFKVLDATGADDTLMKRLGKELLAKGIDVAKETGQEVLQEGLAIGGESLASKYDTGKWAYTWDEAGERLKDTAIDSALAFAGLNVPATAKNFYQTGRDYQAGSAIKDMGDDTVQAIIEEGLATPEDSDAHKKALELKQKLDNGGQVTPLEVTDMYRQNIKDVRQEAPAEAQDPLEAAAREVVARKNEAAQEASQAGQRAPVNVMANNNPTVQQRKTLEQIVKAKTGYGEEGVKSFVNLMEQNNDGNIDKLRSRFQVAYETGLTDAPAKMMKFDNAVQLAAFQAGKADFKNTAERDLQPRKIKVNAKAGFDPNDVSTDNLPEGVTPAALPKDVTREQVRILDDLCKAMGVRGRLVNGLKGNGQISNDEVLFDANFLRERDGKKVSIVTYGTHEIGMHRLMQLAPTEGRAFINAVIQYKNEGLPANALTVSERRRDSYAAQGVNLTTEDAMEEISADAVWDLFGSDEAVADFLRKVDGSNNQQAKKGFQKFVEVMRDLVKKFKAAVAKLTGREKAEAKQALGELEDQLRIYETAFKAAVENRKGIENRAGQEYNGAENRQYALKDLDDQERSAAWAYKAGDSYRINGLLLAGMELDGYYAEMRDALDSALEKLPVYRGTVYRNLGFDDFGGKEDQDAFVAQHQVGVPIRYGAYASSSTTPDGHPIEGEYIVNLEIESVYGRDMEGVGDNFEKEVLFGRNAWFVPAEITVGADGHPLIRMQEVTRNENRLHEGAVEGHRDGDQSIRQRNAASDAEDSEMRNLQKVRKGNGADLRGVSEGYSERVSGRDGGLPEVSEVKYSLVTDEETLDFLDNQKLVKVYRAMQEIDGKLYPPMAALIKGDTGKKQLVEATEKGKWYQADEHPELIKLDKSGKPKFELNKGNGAMVPAAYNPYFHTSMTPLNDQFSSAFDRPNIVVVEGYIPSSELTSGYKAQYAKDSVGETTWHAGPVASKLKGAKARRVYLSRWFKADRVVPTDEVAKTIAETLKGENLSVPWNVVTPELRKALEKQGVSIDYKDIKMGSKVVTFESTQKKYSLKDSEGNELTREQAEYFKDSKARDENGNLLVMYHGTPNAGFTEFRSGSYFTQHKEWADAYQSPSASSISAGKALTNPDTYAVYLNIKKPFDTRNPKERRIFQEEFYRQWGTGTPLADSGLPDWIDGMDLQEFIEENGYDYDGLILDEGGVGGYGDDVVSRGLSYVTFSPEQVKNIDNKTPTDDPDIRFSLKTPREESKNLIAMHNLSAEKLKGALDLGGFPMPSIAIVKNDTGHEEFGDVSVLFRKETINPTDRRNKAYGADAWTPTRPAVGYKVNEKVRKKLEDRIEKLLEGTNLKQEYRLMLDDTNMDDSMNRFDGDFKRAYSRNEALKAAFLKDRGIPFKPVMKAHQYNGTLSNETLRQIVQEAGYTNIIEAQRSGNGAVMQFEPIVRKYYNERMTEMFAGSRFLEKSLVDEVPWAKVDTILRDAVSFFKNGEKKVVDSNATRDKLEKRFGKKLTGEYEAWLDEISADLIEKKGLRNDKDMFTPSGNRRSFEQLYMAYNLDNIVTAMGRESEKGGGVLGTGNIFGAATKEYGSIAEMKADSGRLVKQDEETHKAEHDAFVERFSEITARMIKPGDTGFGATLDAGDAAVDALLNGKTVKGIQRELKSWHRFNATQEIAQDIYDLAKEISEAPTAYFEAKPRRAVGFDEVAAVVMPRKGNADLKARLEERGVQVLTYNAAKEGDRLKKVNSVEDIAFSLKEQGDILAENAKLKETVAGLREQFQTTRFAKVDRKSLDSFTKRLLQDYESGAEINEIRDSLDGLYTYMANGVDGESAVWEEAYQMAYDVAREVLTGAVTLDDTLWQQYKPLREYLRNTKLTLPKENQGDLEAYGGYNEFRKANMGRIKLGNDGLPVDVAYMEMAGMWPDFFNEEAVANPAEQLVQIAEVLDSLKPLEFNPYSATMRESATWLANDIMERFFELPQAKPTFADKAERKLTQQVIKDSKKLERVRLQKNERIKQIIEKSREKVKQTQAKERAKRQEAVQEVKEHYKAKERKTSESRKVREMRAKILRHTAELSKKLLRASDKNHIPQELQGTVAKLLESINLESNYTYDSQSDSYKKNDLGSPTMRTKLFANLRKQYTNLADDLTIDPDLLGDDGLLAEVVELADKKMADMNLTELETIWKAIRAIEASIQSANITFNQSRFATISEAAEALKMDNMMKREKVELDGPGGSLGKIQKLTGIDMMTPEAYFHRLGKAGDGLFRMMRDAQDDHIRKMKQVSDFTHEALKGVNVRKLESQMHTVKLGGRDVQMSTAQIMELYVLMNREHAREHIMVGGILPDVVSKGGLKKVSRAEPVRGVQISEMLAAFRLLTDEQIQIAKTLQDYASTQLSKWGNEAAMKVYNYEKFGEQAYWPIRVNKQETNSSVPMDTQVTSVAGRGFTKGTKPHANNSVRIGSIFDTFATHASEMATYAAWLAPMEDINRIRNFRFKSEGQTVGTVKGIIDRVHGKQGTAYLAKLLADLSNGVKGTHGETNYMSGIVGNYKAASVGANLRVIIQQPTSILRAMDMLEPQYLVAGMRPANGWKKAMKYAPIAQWKDWGYFDINTGRQMKDVLFESDSVVNKVKNVSMAGAGAADSVSWGILWNAVETETKHKRQDLKPGTEAFYEAVAERFNEIVDHTQVVDGILQRSQIMRSPDCLTKMATSFLGEPTKQYNMMASAAYDAANGVKSGKQKLARAAFALAVSGVANAMARAVMDAVRDDDKEKDYWEKWLAALTGLTGDEETLGDKVKNVVLKGNLGSTFNPAGYIPYVKDVLSLIQGYDVSRMDMESIEKTLSAAQNMVKALRGEGKYTIGGASASMFAEVSRLLGIPVANLKREVKSFAMLAAVETDNYLLQYRMEKASLALNYSSNSGTFMDILFKAYQNDQEAYEIIYKDMIESGYDPEKLANGMETRMKKAEGVSSVTDLDTRFLHPDQEPEYNRTMNSIRNSGLWSGASSDQRDKVEEKLYHLVTDSKTGEELQKKIDAGSKYGLDETEYLLYTLALDMYDKPNDEGKLGSYSSQEKADALLNLNLGDSEMAYLWDTDEGFEALEAGIGMDKYIEFKANVGDIKADKNAAGKTIANSRKEKIIDYLNDLGISYEEYLWLLGTEYDTVKKEDDYISYFGKK